MNAKLIPSLKSLILPAMVAALAGPSHAGAAVPQILNYQGRIISNGTNFNGTGEFKFALVNAAGTAGFWNNGAGASASAAEPAAAVSIPVVNGLYSTLLGDTNLPNMAVIPVSVFNNSDVRLRVWFNNGANGFQLLSPDQRLASVGYALAAASVNDGAITTSKLAPGAVGAATLANAAITTVKIGDQAITTPKVADGAITASKLADGILSVLGSTTTNVAFGSCSNCARVDIYGGDNSCKPSITLDGCEQKLRMFNVLGGERLTMSSSAFGTITLKDVGGDTSVYLGIGGLTSGGSIHANSSRGERRVTIDGKTTGGQIKLFDTNGTATVTLDANVSGAGRITTQVLEITGGADLSETFDLGPACADAEPGTVLCIDPENPGRLQPSRGAYDPTVAGILSGAGGINPGMLMGQHGSRASGKHPVALTGRVFCKVDASLGAIRPGDLITTSDVPGYGMKASDKTRAPGAILGKAMTSLASGRGMVLVLVSLQ